MINEGIEELFVKVPNDLVLSPNISNRAVALYYYISECTTAGDYAVVTLQMLLSHFGYRNKDRYYSMYREALDELHEIGYIAVMNSEFNEASIMGITKEEVLYIDVNWRVEDYFQAYIQDVHRLMTYAINNRLKNRDAIIRYYLTIQRWTNFKNWMPEGTNYEHGGRIAYYTAGQAKTAIGIDASTFKKYNDILQELDIFYIDSNYVTSKYKNTATKFGRARVWDKDIFYQRIASDAKHNKQIKYDKRAVNKRRSETQKRNYENKRITNKENAQLIGD